MVAKGHIDNNSAIVNTVTQQRIGINPFIWFNGTSSVLEVYIHD